MSLTTDELLTAIFCAKRLEDLQADVRALMINRLLDGGEGLSQKVCPHESPNRVPAAAGLFPEVDGGRS